MIYNVQPAVHKSYRGLSLSKKLRKAVEPMIKVSLKPFPKACESPEASSLWSPVATGEIP